MMDIREKLLELLIDSELFNDADGKADSAYLADHLIANGVTVQTEEEKWNALNEAYDLGVDSVLHDHFGLSWDDASELRKKVERLQEAKKWIPVTDRLPTKEDAKIMGGYLLAVQNGKKPNVWKWTEVAKYPECFTYWYSLPQPPKGEQQ